MLCRWGGEIVRRVAVTEAARGLGMDWTDMAAERSGIRQASNGEQGLGRVGGDRTLSQSIGTPAAKSESKKEEQSDTLGIKDGWDGVFARSLFLFSMGVHVTLTTVEFFFVTLSRFRNFNQPKTYPAMASSSVQPD